MKFGTKVKDKITGFEGIVTGKASYITGCDQYLVQPPVYVNDWKDGRWFDEGRLVFVEDAKITEKDVQVEDNGADIQAPTK